MIKHRIKCFDSELLVRVAGESRYELTIQASSNPLGLGNVLSSFESQEAAEQAAERFCTLFSAAREKGYYLKEKQLTKPDREAIEVERLFEPGLTVEAFVRQLG